jgi:hypothetical protein
MQSLLSILAARAIPVDTETRAKIEFGRPDCGRGSAGAAGRVGGRMAENQSSVDARLLEAVDSSDPGSAVHELAVALRTEGMMQVEMYRAFLRILQSIPADDPRYDAVADTMDLIWGWCPKGKALFDAPLTDERLRSECVLSTETFR